MTTQAIFFDISKAFEKYGTMAYYGNCKLLELEAIIIIRGTLLHWFENYLAERKQAVVLHGSRSDYLTVPAGVPQDSVLEPFLFLIYIDDILEDIESVINFSADDTIMYLG